MDKSCPIESKPVASIRSDDDQLQTFNSLTPLVVSPHGVVQPLEAWDDVNEEKRNTTTHPPLMVEPLQTIKPIDDSIKDSNDVEGGLSIVPMILEPSYDVNDETRNTTPLSPPLEVTPLRTILPSGEMFTTTTLTFDEANNADAGSSSVPTKRRRRGRPVGSKKLMTTPKKLKTYDPTNRKVKFCLNFDSGITEEERDTGNKELVDLVLMRFDAVRRRLGQVNCGHAQYILEVALNNCMNLGVMTNLKKRIGAVPGVQVGDIFYNYKEMCLVGLHKLNFAGIDYLMTEEAAVGGPIATSVVTSRQCDDETVDFDTLIYTGAGGKDKNGQARDQKLKKGNLALEGSRRNGTDVRVIRGVEDPHRKKKKIYIYDGLYSVTDFRTVKGQADFLEFKFRMLRKQNQPSGYAIWKEAENLRKHGHNSRKGFILEDISYGNELLPVSLVNEVDENKQIPEVFEYIRSQYYSNTTRELQIVPHDADCIGIQKNGGVLPYHENLLVCRKPMIYECGESCPCPSNCKNRVVHNGLKIRLEVFKTENCGWGLRSLEPIRAGTFICEFVGVNKTREEVEEEDEYLFDTSRVYKPFKWNYEPELVAEHFWERVPEVFEISSPVLISARQQGNVARFMNHSCSPNVFWQPIEYEQEGEAHIRIGFFAMNHIPPLTELRYDYGGSYVEIGDDEEDETLIKGKKTCLCGSFNCRGSFG